MTSESHPWLQWPGCDNDRKIELNNQLALIQSRGICPPRVMDWNVTNQLGIADQLDNLFMTRESGLAIPVWSRAFDVREDVYREWCLEFYASLRVDRKFKPAELMAAKLIHFRLGGRTHHVSVPEFGVLTGLFTRAKVEHAGMGRYLVRGTMNSEKFVAQINQRWYELSGIPNFTTTSKIAEVRIPILRVIHKLITYSFLNRSTQNDKVYTDDLWLLYLFSLRDQTRFADVPWVLVNYMDRKGAGRHRSSQMGCGHFITRIARNLGLYIPGNTRVYSRAVKWKLITRHDLEASGLLNRAGTELIAGGTVQAEQGAAQESRSARGRHRGMSDESAQVLREIQWSLGQLGQQMGSLAAGYEYHRARYAPYMEGLAAAASSGAELSPYAPPPVYYPQPIPPQEPQDDSDDDDDADDEEETDA